MDRLCTHFVVVLLQTCKVLASFRELALFHAFTHIPMDKGTLGIHDVELVVDAVEDLRYGSAVGDHANIALHLGNLRTWNRVHGLAVDPALETSGAPVHKLDGALGLCGLDSHIHILGHHIAPVQQTCSHVLAVAGIALCHHGARLESCRGDVLNTLSLSHGFLSGHDWGKTGEHKVYPRVRDQIGLELINIHIQLSIKSQGRCHGGDYLA
mmetsp:Transcript_2356/g.15753  ORF Transcript_2356/g.15753 Transcript_2356/m.15753 type:complete len:211 (-) Transcript_2356:816-1448(-)